MSTETVPDRSKSDPDIAALLRAYAVMQGADEPQHVAYLEGLIRRLRRRNDRLAAGHDAGLAARGALLDRAIRRIVAGRP
jgi:hypothetical protein